MFEIRFLPTVLLAGAVCLLPSSAHSQQVGADRDEQPESIGVTDGPLPAFEPALLDLIFKPETARPSDLHVALKTERFRAGPNGWSVPVVLSVAAADLMPLPASPAAGDDAIDFRIDALALVTNAEGRIVVKSSRSAHLRTVKDQIVAFLGERVPLTCEATGEPLPPGRYTLQVGVYDPTARRGTVIERTFTLPEVPPPGTPALSSLVLSRYAEPARDADGLFVVGGKTRIVSDAAGLFSKSRDGNLIAFYTLYGMPGVQYQARILFLSGGKQVATTPMETLPAVDATGQVRAAPVVPLDSFAPGAYRAVLQIFAPGSLHPVVSGMTPFALQP